MPYGKQCECMTKVDNKTAPVLGGLSKVDC